VKSKAVKIILMGVILAGGMSSLTSAALYVDPNNEFVVTNTTAGEAGPCISGLNVSWASIELPSRCDIFYRTLPNGSSTNITNNPSFDQDWPDIYENTIVYIDYTSGNGVIMVHTIGGGTYQLTSSGSRPQISGDLVVWYDSSNIYGKYLSGGSEFQVTTSNKARHPAVDGNIVVWNDWRNYATTGYDIYAKNISGGSEFAVCSASGNQGEPDVSGNIIVWQDERDYATNHYDIYGYNLKTGTEFPVAVGPGAQRYPAVYGNYIVWAEGSIIKCYSLISGQIIDVIVSQSSVSNPAIDGNTIVWTDYRNGNSDIYGNYLLGAVPPREYGEQPNPDVFEVTSTVDGTVHILREGPGGMYDYPKLLVRSAEPFEWDVENGRIYPSDGATEGEITFLKNKSGWTDYDDYDLEPGETYYYRIYTVDDSYWYSSGLTRSIVVAGTPRSIHSPTNVYTEALDGKTIIHLTNPNEPDYASTLILRSTSSISWSPTDGQSYPEGQTVASGVIVISNSAGTTDYLDTDLTNSQQYYYRAFAVTGSLEYSIGKQVTATPTRKPASHLYRMLNQWGGLGTNDEEFSSEGGPQGITMLGQDSIFVSDYGNKQIKEFSKTGDFIGKYESLPGNKYKLDDLHYDFGCLFGTGKTNYSEGDDDLETYIFTLIPRAGGYVEKLLVAPETTHASICSGQEWSTIENTNLQIIYICLTTENKIKKYYLVTAGFVDPYGEWGQSGTAPGQLSGPLSIVKGKDGFIYVGDETGRIQKFGINGHFYEIACQLDPSKGEMPLDMAVDRWGCFYVATSAYRVLKFDPDWNFLTGWGRAGSEDGEFCRAARICVDSQDNVYVSDGDWPGDAGALQNQRIQVFTETDQHGSEITFTGYIAEPINTATGNFTYEHTDLTVPGPGLSFNFERFYNHQDDYEGVFGKGWRHSYEMRASEDDDGSVIISWPNGHYDKYEIDGSDYVPKLPGVYNTLVKNGDNTFTLTRTDQLKYNFAVNGKLESIVDRNGNTITLTYSATGKLSAITDAVSRLFTIAYNENGRLASLTDPISRVINYNLDSNNNLISVTDANEHTTQFLYDSKHRITKIINPRGYTLLENTYDEYNRVIEQKDAKNNSTSFDYKTVDLVTPWGTVAAYTGVTEVNDPLGHITKHEYDGLSRLPTVTAADSSITESQYDENDNRTAWTDEVDNTTDYQYDSQGNVIQKTDTASSTTSIAYDSYNNPLQKTDALGNTTSYTYDSYGNLIDTNDPLGQITHRTYFNNGLVHTVTDPNGNMTTYDYDSYGNLTTITDSLGRVTTYTYDLAGRKLSQANPLGQITEYQYDATDNLISVTDPNDRITSYEYDENGNKIRERYPDGNDREFIYDEMDLLVAGTDEAGFITTYQYDALGHLVEVSDPCSNITSYTYDDVGNRISTTNARENTTTYVYDSRGNQTDVYDPNGGHTIYEYDALNRRTKVIDPLGNQAQYEYDVLGRVTKVIDPNGDFATTAYDALGRLTSTTDKNGNQTSYKYDPVGNPIEVNEPNGIITTHTYDAVGNKISSTDPLGRTITFEYDALNRLIRTTDPLGHTAETVYDDVGRVVQKIDAKGRITKYDYDIRDRLIRVTDPAGYQTNYSYDVRGNLISTVNARYKETTYEYDALNRLIKVTNPLALERAFEYDAVGNKTALTDEDSQITTYEYDKNNRLILESFPDGNSTSYKYDLARQLIEMTDSLGVTSYQYDNKGQFISKTDPFGQTVGYTYDPVGNKSSITYPGDKTVEYFYDQYNYLVEIDDWLGNVTDYFYDYAGQLIETVLPNDDFTVYDYDNAGRLIQQASKTDTNEPICDYTIELDEVGNRIAIDYNQPTPPVPPTEEQIIDYIYDDADRLIETSDANYAFSNRGNLIEKDTGTEITNYNYDSHDWLTEVAKLAEQWLNSYDGTGHRLEVESSSDTTRYTIDPTGGDMWNILAETDETDTPQVYYIYGNGLAYLIDATTNQPVSYHYDPIGSTVALTNSSGEIIDSYSYEEFGQLLTSSGTTANPYQYVGKFGVATAPDDLLFMRARYYDPATGRFSTTDPVEGGFDNPQSLHDYLYVSANPIKNIDPHGKFNIPILLPAYVNAGLYGFAFGELEGLITNVAMDLTRTPYAEAQDARAIKFIFGSVDDVLSNVSVSDPSGITLAFVGGKFLGKGAIGQLYGWDPSGEYLAPIVAPYLAQLLEDTGVAQILRDTILHTDYQDPDDRREHGGGGGGGGAGGSGEDGIATASPNPQTEGTQSYSQYGGRQTIYHTSRLMDAVENWTPPSRPYIRERYEPKFRIINKDNAKDLRK